MNRLTSVFPVCFACVLATLAAGFAPANAAALRQDAYVWQRSWNDAVLASVSARGTNFSELITLTAEVSWKQKQPVLIRPSVNYPALQALQRPVGLALRIGPFSGPFTAEDERTHWLTNLAGSLLAEAQSNHLAVAELQLDFDCAEAKLDGYRVWVEALRQRIAPVPLTITTLPAWLKQPTFRRLIETTDGYVLQVHSLERPKDVNAPFTLCDPAKARRAVEQAGQFSVPFRVALPTYGYTVAFDQHGKFMALSAEGPQLAWPQNVQLREVQSDPASLAELVAEWSANHPASMQGVIWYRLPIAGERLNWRWPTLAEVMQGHAPQASIAAALAHPQPALVEVQLTNRGSAPESAPMTISLRWQNGRAIASDGLQGFEVIESGPNELRFRSAQSRLEAGQSCKIGWVRFDQETDARVEIQPH